MNRKYEFALFLVGLFLLTVNVVNFFIPLKNPKVYNKKLDFPFNTTISYKEALAQLEKLDKNDKKEYVTKANEIFNREIAHYWKDKGIKKYNLRVPFYENYFLFSLSFIFPDEFQKYQFCNYQKALERGVGLCSQLAIAITDFLNKKGIETLMVGLDGHVVATTKVGENEWWIIDPDFDVVIPYDLKFLEKNSDIVKEYYRDRLASDGVSEAEIADLYGESGNVIYSSAKIGNVGYINCNWKKVLIEKVSYVLIWVIPLGLMLPFAYRKSLKSTNDKKINSKKRILHLITGLEVGGAEMMLLKTLPLLQDYFDNEVCCIRGRGPIGEKLEQQGIPVQYLDLNIFKFVRKLKNSKPDLLVTYLIHADILGRIIGRTCGVKKVICNQRGFYLNWSFLRILDRWTKFLVTKYFVQTKFAQAVLMRELKLSEEKFEVIPNAVNINEFNFNLDNEKKKKDLGIPNENINIVSVGTLKQRKGFEELLKAFEKTYEDFKDINLLIVGGGGEKEKYLDQIKNYSSKSNIFFLDQRDDVKEILRISDIFVLATYSEGMSNAILEAMASKLAIITTDIEVNRELIEDGISGFLIPVKNSDAIAEKLEFLIKDEERRKFLGEKAYNIMLNKFEINKVIELIKSNYEKVIYDI